MKLTGERLARFLEMVKAGSSPTEICQEIGCHFHDVASAEYKHGVRARRNFGRGGRMKKRAGLRDPTTYKRGDPKKFVVEGD